MIAYNTSIVRDGLVLHLDAANVKSYPGSGTVWKDLSGLGNDSTLVNGVGYSPDNKGAMVFDGLDDVCMTPITATGIDSLFSVAVWFTLTSTASSNADAVSKRLVSADQTSLSSTKWCIGVTPNREFLFGGATGAERAQRFVIELNTPYYVVLTHNTSTYSIFLNGINMIRDDTSTIGSTSFGNVAVGARPYAPDRRWTGSIFATTFYARVLSDSEIQQNFEATRGRYGI